MRSGLGRREFIQAATCAAALAAVGPARAAPARVVAAGVIGPIPVTAQSGEPFRGANEQPVAPFAPDKLKSLYGRREAYLARFDSGIDQMVQGRWLLAQDAEKLKAEEAKRPLF